MSNTEKDNLSEYEIERKRLLEQLKLDKQNRDKKYEEVLKEIIPQKGDIKVEDVNFPITTRELHNKNPYRDYLYYTSKSNFLEWENKTQHQRYLYKNKIDKKEIEKTLNITRPTINNNFKKLQKLGFIVEDEVNPKVYRIRYSEKGSGDFVLLHKNIIKKLINVFNNDAISVYLFFCYKLREKSQIITREEICKVIKLNPTKRNLEKVSSITETLENEGLIGKMEYMDVRNKKPRTLIIYTLATYEEYKSGKYRHLKSLKEMKCGNYKI